MKKFKFRLEVIVYGDTEDEAREVFCDDPGAWEFDESDLTLVREEGTTNHSTLVATVDGVLNGMTDADERVTLFQEIAGDYCLDCGFKKYGTRCYCRDCS